MRVAIAFLLALLTLRRYDLRVNAVVSCQLSVIGHQVQGVSAQGGAGAFSGCNAKG
ncbi:MAG: hypothetical protein RM368_18210 [Nostoc sp. DedSLP03]|uniref:hypothetical protein n=1 Tax=Nostoc sp. DedSLP03 TaxID=3075400 RepID=UPI002AD335E5|nr:hypothetical protein [Nostoc sp. DedSLP03]MDZ7966884.1 hypothetical protein [Nostoc sp. DedSLP03]